MSVRPWRVCWRRLLQALSEAHLLPQPKPQSRMLAPARVAASPSCSFSPCRRAGVASRLPNMLLLITAVVTSVASVASGHLTGLLMLSRMLS